MSDKLKVAMVGVGNYGARRRKLMRETGLFEIVAAYDLNAEALKKCQEEDGAETVSSYEKLLETPGIEAMVISTGAKFHAEQTLQALDKGLHVFVEKPLCSTVDEVNALLKKQQETALVVGVGHHDHSSENESTAIKAMLEKGEFGDLVTFEKTTAHSGGLQIKPGDWRGDPEKNPGGMLFQCGVHALHELMYLFGPVASVQCQMVFDINTNTKTADIAHCILTFESGLKGVLSAYHLTPYRHSFNIFGTKQNLYIDSRCPPYGDPSYIAVQVAVDGCKAEKHQEIELKGVEEDPNGSLKSFYNAVRTGSKCYPDLLDGAKAVAVVFAAEESAKTGKVVRINDILEV